MQNSPFKLYDFLGYAFPGALVLLEIITLWNYFETYDNNPVSVVQIIESAVVLIESADWCKLLIFIAFSYLIGNLISYVSSMTVEKLAIFLYGYPSEFLMEQTSNPIENYKNGSIRNNQIIAIIFLYLLLIPIVLFDIIFGYLLGIRIFTLKPLDKFLQEVVNNRIGELIEMLGLNYDDKYLSNNNDFHSIVHHYVYMNNISSVRKTDNYVALYGFNRTICFIFNITTYLFLVLMFVGYIKLSILFIIILMFLSYLSFLSFMKFYRRYTLENFMELIVDTRINHKSKSPFINLNKR